MAVDELLDASSFVCDGYSSGSKVLDGRCVECLQEVSGGGYLGSSVATQYLEGWVDPRGPPSRPPRTGASGN